MNQFPWIVTIAAAAGGINGRRGNILGNFHSLRLVSALGTAGQALTANVLLGTRPSACSPFSVGQAFNARDDDPIDYIEVQNPCTFPINVYVLLSTAAAIQDSVVSGVVAITGDVTVESPDTIPSAPDVAIVGGAAAALILAAAAGRREAIITNIGANPCRIGDASIGAARGIPLAMGETVFLTTTAALYAYSALGCTVAVNRTAVV